jgi:hypothetical protein
VIPHFPDPYPGEAFYSVYARFCERLGLDGNSTASRFFFGKSCEVSVQLPHGFDHVASNLPPGHSYTAGQLIDQHTLLPLFAPFIQSMRYQQAKSDMHGNGGAGIRSRLGLTSGIRWPNRLRHCSVCDTENRDRFGETFWARLHQITGVNVCPVHRCFLEDTSVTRLSRGCFKAISAEAVCRNTAPRYIDDSNPEQVVQFGIARDAAWLLNINRLRPGPEALSKSYLYCAVNQGLATYSGKFRQLGLHSAFAGRYSKELLQRLGFEFKEGNNSWLRKVFQKPAETQYPILHLIIMNFLGFAVADFFDRLPGDEWPGGEPFGAGPWPCLNPVSACRNNLLIEQCTVRPQFPSETTNYRNPIGDFQCTRCGFEYSRIGPDTSDEDEKRLDWVREYGHAWKAELRRVWADREFNITQVASHLGVTARVIRTQAARCGLVIAKPGQRFPERAKDCRVRPSQRKVPTQEQFAANRSRWSTFVSGASRTTIGNLRDDLASLHRWLYRYDRDWLTCNIGFCDGFGPNDSAVYWALRDTDLSRRVADAASTLFQAPGKPVRVTQSAIFRLLEHSEHLYTNRDKLPATVRSISAVVESEEEFAHRLLRQTVTESASARVPLVRWRLKCAIGYGRLKKFPSVRLELESILAEDDTNGAQLPRLVARSTRTNSLDHKKNDDGTNRFCAA